MAVDKDFYNEASAAKLGWEPSWFIPEYTLFDRKLQNAIRAFQREHRLLADGMCGPTTYRHILAKIEAELQYEVSIGRPMRTMFYGIMTSLSRSIGLQIKCTPSKMKAFPTKSVKASHTILESER